jgi:hypothetical protein
VTREGLAKTTWCLEKIDEYMKPFDVIKGVNYVPAYCYSYIEIWHHFNEEWILRELGYAKDIGMNSLRIFVAACQWQTHKDLVCANLDRFLHICEEFGFSVMLTLQPNTYMRPNQRVSQEEDPFEIAAAPSGHDRSWRYKGAQIFDCEGRWIENRGGIASFVTEIVRRYGHDQRVSFWDLYNEPWEANQALLDMVFSLARAENPDQPLTSCWRSHNISDITSFHCYEQPGKTPYVQPNGVHYRTFEDELALAVSTGRPILCTECVARTMGNELKAFLPYYSRAHIGFYIWGLCAGSAQYHIPWHWPSGSPEPRRWFQCLLYPDGTPFDPEEIELIRSFHFSDPKAETSPVS